MYSKSKGMQYGEYALTPPPGYDGSRFRRRSDGRDDAFPLYGEPCKKGRERSFGTSPPVKVSPPDETETDRECEAHCECEDEEKETAGECESCIGCTECERKEPCRESKKGEDSGLMSFIQGLPGEELLLIALIVLLAGSEDRAGLETVMVLALLLCL